MTAYAFVHRWWIEDRIRLSPTVGRWLRIQIGDSLLVRNTLFDVCHRTTMVGLYSSQVILNLRQHADDSQDIAVLRIDFAGPTLQFVSSTLTTKTEMIELFEDDPVIVTCKSTTEYD